MVVNLPVKDVDDVAADDLARAIETIPPITEIETSIKSLSDVTELVTVAYAFVPAAAHMEVTSTMCTFPSSLSIVMRDFACVRLLCDTNIFQLS